MAGEPGEKETGGQQTPQAQLEAARAAAEFYKNRFEQQLEMGGPLMRIFDRVEVGGVENLPEQEKRELGKDYHEAMRGLNGGIVYLVKDMRTHFTPQTWPLLGLQQRVDSIRQTLKDKSGVRAPKAVLTGEETEEERSQKERPFAVDKAYRSRLSADLNIMYGFTMLSEFAAGPMSLYFEGKGMAGILDTGRRISVISTEDLDTVAGHIKDKGLKPEFLDKLPEEMKEGVGEKLAKYHAQILHYNMALASMNQFNPEFPDGQEMTMAIPTTEREFLAGLFKRMNVEPEEGSQKTHADVNKPEKQTLKVIAENGKEFWVNVLCYYNSIETEKELKRYISLMAALAMTDAHSVLKNLPQDYNELSRDPVKMVELDKLHRRVENIANDIVENWHSPDVSVERELAVAAFEHSFDFEVGTLDIADTGHGYTWDLKYDQGDGRWHAVKFLDEIGNPDMALDAVNAKYAFLHEITYRHKNRISSALIPPTDRKFIEKWINYSTHGGKDTELKDKLGKNVFLARGAGMLGLFAGTDLAQTPAWKEGENYRKSLGLECNHNFLKFLEENMWGLPTAYGVDFPMPVLPFFDTVNLLSAMTVSKDVTVKDLLNKGKLLTEINFEEYHPFVADGNAASNKFIMNFTKMIWGRVDSKTLDEFFSSPYSAITDMIKWGDIGTRYEKTNKKFHEIAETCYMIVAYLAFYKSGIWNGNDSYKSKKDTLLDKTTFSGVIDFIEAASYLADNKQGQLDHYRDSFVLLLSALTEFAKGVGVNADLGYTSTKDLRTKVHTALHKT